LTRNSLQTREASYPLLQYLSQGDGGHSWEFDPPFVNDASPTKLTILDLGAGTGIVTSKIRDIVANRDHDIVIATDLAEVCPLLEENLQGLINNNGGVRVRPLKWGDKNDANEIGTELGLLISNSARGGDAHEPRHLTHIVCSDLVCINI
jgi:hypothetical protein